MAVVSTEKDAPQIGVPVGSRERVEALGVPTRNIATCSAHTPDNRGCPMWAICDRAFKGDRPHNQIVRRISSSGGLRVYHAPCFDIVGKEGTARGVFTQPQMLPAAEKLQAAVAAAKAQMATPAADEDSEEAQQPLPVSLPQRAWPCIDMLERTARSGSDAHITWQAAADF